jgi:hypothetical protein
MTEIGIFEEWKGKRVLFERSETSQFYHSGFCNIRMTPPPDFSQVILEDSYKTP